MVETSVAALVKRLRSERNESLRAAARVLEVDPSYLSRVEAGTRTPSEDVETRISEYYGVDRDLLDLAAGRVPPDVLRILCRHPEILSELRSRYVE